MVSPELWGRLGLRVRCCEVDKHLNNARSDLMAIISYPRSNPGSNCRDRVPSGYVMIMGEVEVDVEVEEWQQLATANQRCGVVS